MEPPHPAQPLGARLKSAGGALADLLEQIRRLQSYEALLSKTLPPPLLPHVRVAGYKGGTLRLNVDSAEWATRLRFLESRLLAELRNDFIFIDLRRLEYKIHPVSKPVQSARPAPRIPPQSADHIAKVAKYIEDEALRKALLELASKHLDPPAL